MIYNTKRGGNGVSIFIGNGELHYQFGRRKNHLPPKGLASYFANDKDKKQLRFSSKVSDASSADSFDMYRMDVVLEGANKNALVVADSGQDYYENYHTAAVTATAHAYGRITYKDIYPHIDWALYIKDNKLEYDFIVRPGGDVKDIKIKYNGATDIAKGDKSIRIKTPMGEISETRLYAYEQSTGRAVAADFKLKGKTTGFSLPENNRRQRTAVVIDPTLVWGTYFGGDGYQQSSGVACDSGGNIYNTGYTFSANNVVSTGAYQTVLSGGEDAYLVKFAGDGSLLWATYFGGNNTDGGNAVCADQSGNVYIGGFTHSTDSVATAGAFQTVYGGNEDGFLAKFTASGSLLWATYVGGDSSDNVFSVVCDTASNVYIAGVTLSYNGIATAGAWQPSYGGGGNGFIAKFNNSGSRQWGTYFGGSGETGCAQIASDTHNYIYVTGGTGSTDGIATTGTWQGTFNGGIGDAYLAKLDLNGRLIWGTYYGGEGQDYGEGGIGRSSRQYFFMWRYT